MDTVDISLDEIQKHIKSMNQIYNQDIGVLNKLNNDKKEYNKELEKHGKEKDELGLERTLLQEACKEARKNGAEVLQNIATNGLQYIMGNNISLNINIDEKKAPAECEFEMKTEYGDYIVENDPADGDGGGVADIVSFNNFFGYNSLAGKKTSAPIFLDEPTKFVSAGHSDKVGRYLYEMSAYSKKQIWMITHDKFLATMADKAFLLELDDKGKSLVTEI